MGRWVVLFFYSSNFEITDELVYLNQFNNQPDTQIIGIAIHSDFQQMGFALKYKLQLPLLPDEDRTIGRKYHIRSENDKYIPTCIIIDPNGKIIQREETNSSQKIITLLNNSLNNKS